jgi:Beta-lactamase enzyme family
VGLVGLGGGFVILRGATPTRRAPPAQSKKRAPPVIAVTHHVAPGSKDLFAAPSVAAYLAGVTDSLTAAVYDGATGEVSVYRPGVAQETGSIMKVDILATLLAEDQAHGEVLTPSEDGLSQDMIEQSDNDDAQDLWDAEGGATAVARFDTAAGLTQTTPDAAGYWGLSTTTAADQVQLLRGVAYPNDVLTTASRDYELGLMSHVDADQAWGVSSGVGPNASVALKNGWIPLDSGGWQVNSIGYIDGDGRNYVVAMLSDGNATEAQGIDTLQGLSALLWQALAPSAPTPAPLAARVAATG